MGEVWADHVVVFPDIGQTLGSQVMKKFTLWQEIR